MKHSLTLMARRVAVAALCAVAMAATAVAQIPDRPMPAAFVNDMAGLLTPAGAERVERELTCFSDSTTSQITVVTVTDLGGYDIADYAQQLGDKWGIGRKGKDNGVVMVVCANVADSTGKAFIASGYGMEGALTDVACARIVRNVMGPLFKAGDYDGAIEAGCRAVMDATRGEFSAADESSDEWSGGEIAALVIILALILLYFVSSIFIDWYNRAETRREKITSALTFLFVLASIYTAVARILVQIAASFGGGRGGSSSSKGGGGGSFGGGGGGGSW